MSDLHRFMRDAATATATATAGTAIGEAANETVHAPVRADLDALLAALAQNHFSNPFQAQAQPLQPPSLAVQPESADCQQAMPNTYCLKDDLISLNYTEADLRDLLQTIAYAAGANILISDAVSGKITLNLRAVHWQKALELVMTNRGLASRTSADVLLIGPEKAITEQQQSALLRQQLEQKLMPLQTEYIRILHAKSAEVAALLTGIGDANQKSAPSQVRQRLLSERGHLLVDTRSNGLILTDTPDRFLVIKKLLAEIDKPVRQVMVEARIVTANTNFSRHLGVSWGGGGLAGAGLQHPIAISGSRAGLAQIRGAGLASSGGLAIDLGAESVASSLAVGLIGGRFMLDLELSALVTEGEGDVVARPKIVTADKQSATIISGVEVPFQENSTSGATSTSFKRAVMALEVRPHITPDDRISMDLKVNQDSVGGIIGGVPLINTNQISTRVLVKDGQTVVLGGVYRLSQSKTITKTPVLGDIPIIQWFFRRTRNMREKQELLIFITPKIVRDDEVDLAPTTEEEHIW